MQGFNMGRYVPPDQEGLTSANKLAGKHPLGARARHLHTTGALIVRFEMPFAVWCTTCKPHETIIGQGVRFNAEKKKIGNYYSTPIYSFRMKHTVCGGWIEIRTDPENTAYVVHEGGRKRDTGEDKELQPGEFAIRMPGLEQDPAEKDPFAKIEGKIEDKMRASTEAGRILDLQDRQSRDWDDPYAQSKRLRKTFRTERKGLEKLATNREALQDKMSLGIELVDETEGDRRRAGMIDFGQDETSAVGVEAARITRTRPMFEQQPAKNTQKRDRKGDKSTRRSVNQLAQRKVSLQHELTGNTRAVVDPFLNDVSDTQDIWKPGVKRKKPTNSSTTPTPKDDTEALSRGDSSTAKAAAPSPADRRVSHEPPVLSKSALVNYTSDSDDD
ncbi:hypothetical protein N7478_007768 [Penicillium angulare]|uniref:uncharacterized protein n=1 Tax=Penicillium angulare TaxID=116970 RepID=UPI002541F14F|nr:uncharacterized protein N7478_007768 [Penicillium angulare]KAJ5272643.1 hypothetical protein N7478_007768 [Penicillium angulare]